MKIQKMISLDTETAIIAKQIGIEFQTAGGFSYWIRNQLRSYRNQTENDDSIKANTARKVEELTDISTARLLWHLERRSLEEIRALVNLLQGV